MGICWKLKRTTMDLHLFWNQSQPMVQKPPCCHHPHPHEPGPMTVTKEILSLMNFLFSEKKKSIWWSYQRCRTPNNFALVVVLRTMAGTNELVLCCIPWHNTTKMGAYTIDTISCKSFVILYNKISRISLASSNWIQLSFFF